MTNHAGIGVELLPGIARLMIDAPPANTWSLDNLRGLVAAIAQVSGTPGINALILTGAGTKFFSAGASLQWIHEHGKAGAAELAEAFGAAFDALAKFPGVTIAAINGYALGGGLEAALSCDIRICEEQARLGLPEARVGLLPAAGGTQRLRELVGSGWAKRIILCGEQVDAATARTIGLVEEVVPTGSAYARALELAQAACRLSPASLRACKTLIDADRRVTVEPFLADERTGFVALFDHPDQREGVEAFLGKREPRWQEAHP